MPSDTLRINEIFHSIQGESTHAGRPCVFVRLTGCHLRCTWCDTEYAFYEGRKMTLVEIIARVDNYGCDLVEITGGEPLLQPNVHPLMTRLADAGRTVLLETSGACDIATVDPRVIRIMDLKTPSSGECRRNRLDNIANLRERDEVKFVIEDRTDYEWARNLIDRFDLVGRCSVLVSPVHGRLEPVVLAEWVLADRLSVRFQLQLHKFIWSPETRGV